MRRTNNIILAVLACLPVLAACSKFNEAEWASISELFPKEKMVTVDMEGGESTVRVYTSGSFHAQLLHPVRGIEMMTPAQQSGDADIVLRFSANTSYRRSAAVRLTLDGTDLCDTILFRQKGIDPFIRCNAPFFTADGSRPDRLLVPLSTNVSSKDIRTEIRYDAGAGDWVSGISWGGDIAWDDDNISISTAVSDLDKPSRATVRLSFADGWGEDIHEDLAIFRTSRDGSFGRAVSLQEVKDNAGAGVEWGDFDYFEGVVISDCLSKNTALNPSVAYNVVDTTVSNRTVYVMDRRGGNGIRLLFKEGETNTLRQGMDVKVRLKGLEVQREDNPVRYSIVGLNATSILSAQEGTVPVATRKKLSQLSDDDLYTLVTLTDLEFVNKGGAYTNVYEGYSLKTSFNPNNITIPTDCAGCLMVDDELKAVFCPVNMLCPWRRPVSGLPRGVCDVTGILVHEELTRVAGPGKYQLRVLDEEGFAPTGEESRLEDIAVWNGAKWHYDFSQFAEKYAYDGANTIVPSEDYTPASGTARGELTFENKKTTTTAYLRSMRNYSRSDYAEFGCLNNRSLGVCSRLEGWYNFGEDGSLLSTNGLVATLNTEGLGGNAVLAYVSFNCWGSAGWYRVFPAHWCLEYALDGESAYTPVPPILGDKPWVRLLPGPYGVAWISGRRYYPSSSMSAGYSDHVFALPADILGKSGVRIRLRPYDEYINDYPTSSSTFSQPCDVSTINAGSSADTDIRIAEISFKTIK